MAQPAAMMFENKYVVTKGKFWRVPADGVPFGRTACLLIATIEISRATFAVDPIISPLSVFRYLSRLTTRIAGGFAGLDRYRKTGNPP